MIVPGDPILTAAQMRAAEGRLIAAGSSVGELMERAGAGIAEWVHRLAAGSDVLILCGPGNNGGDGYVAARLLAGRGMAVRVAALAEPRTDAAAQARARWNGPVEPFSDAIAAGSAVFVDAVFGTGLSRPLDPTVARKIEALAPSARLAIAVDVPSFLNSDTGENLGSDAVTPFDVTLALGALKPAHVLHPGASRCGAVRVVDIGLDRADIPASVARTSTPSIAKPQPSTHKYSRGMVAVVGGPMHGASELAALSAYRAGAGYVLLLTGGLPHPPHAIVRQRWSADALADERIGAVVVGPGLGRDDRAREKLDVALATAHPLVIDGDALHLLDPGRLHARQAPTVLTPHAGEFAALFGEEEGSKIVRAQAAARRSNAVLVFKGADTVIASPDGRANVLPAATPWLSVAGTGDVLAGAIGAMLAQANHAPFEAASAGTWLHATAANMLNRCFLADELADALPYALERAHG
ncbi:NAD(P)H-hydrate dehydratase [Sphingomonas sp. MG17]|uniref:Bifunctional NAD(P)H-hydrate repair enzyme n=1 Tax=Sphingomonas tagetis TaxID=2949092 RepID=A0A9X2HHM0_9SPHN|nr:NAD(P)H-hydrate dehydratase [Sphingomonas tagetis]MCP3729006.1 NAD(P)H-hydrate dehydratase [Sphingomonas tagetis]